MNPTVSALMSKGVSNRRAKVIVALGLTLQDLQLSDDACLVQLGLSDKNIEAIRKASRPSIPDDTLNKLFEESRETCCICEKSHEPIEVHHIVDWAKSHSHEEGNLVVLCPNDHARAHMPSRDKRHISAEKIRGAKTKWKSKVQELIRNQHNRLVSEKQARWFWVNLQNLNIYATRNRIRLASDQMPELVKRLRNSGFIDGDGNITPASEWQTEKEPEHWFLDFKQGMDVATYLSDLMDTTARELNIVDLNLFLGGTGNLRQFITTTMHVAVRANFNHQVDRDFGKYPSETHMRVAESRIGNVSIRFSFDSWYGLSMTSKGNHLLGHHEQTVVGQVTACNQINDETVIELSALGISADFETYHPSQGAWVQGQK